MESIHAIRDGNELPMPKDIDALMICMTRGDIYIDLRSPIHDVVLLRPSMTNPQARLILSPMDSGRIAVGIIPCG